MLPILLALHTVKPALLILGQLRNNDIPANSLREVHWNPRVSARNVHLLQLLSKSVET